METKSRKLSTRRDESSFRVLADSGGRDFYTFKRVGVRLVTRLLVWLPKIAHILKSSVLWDITQCNLLKVHRIVTSFEADLFLGLVFDSVDGGDIFLRNADWLSADCTELRVNTNMLVSALYLTANTAHVFIAYSILLCVEIERTAYISGALCTEL
jgi:hypothetical protein